VLSINAKAIPTDSEITAEGDENTEGIQFFDRFSWLRSPRRSSISTSALCGLRVNLRDPRVPSRSVLAREFRP